MFSLLLIVTVAITSRLTPLLAKAQLNKLRSFKDFRAVEAVVSKLEVMSIVDLSQIRTSYLAKSLVLATVVVFLFLAVFYSVDFGCPWFGVVTVAYDVVAEVVGAAVVAAAVGTTVGTVVGVAQACAGVGFWISLILELMLRDTFSRLVI